MNNDLISRSALLELAHNHVGGTVDCNDIARFPAVDAEPVRHGRWEWADDGYLRCGECTQKAPTTTQYQDEPIQTATNYCPNCGARMDVEVEG